MTSPANPLASETPRGRSPLGPPGSCLVRALRPCRIDGIARAAGAEFFCELSLAHHMQRTSPPFLEIIPEPRAPFNWREPQGRMLRAFVPKRAPWRVVACVNIWNDLPALRASLPLWITHVDAVHVADGNYQGEPSDDGVLEYLLELGTEYPEKAFVLLGGGGWSSQIEKRTALLQSGCEGDLMFVVDADEFVHGADQLRWLPDLDCGWVTMLSTLYTRPYGQPRLFRWVPGLRYAGRHHWVFRGEELLATHQYAGLGLHGAAPIQFDNRRGWGHSSERAAAKKRNARAQSAAEAAAVALPGRSEASDSAAGGRESLRILQLTHYDPGMVAYRLHNGINCTTPHASVLGSAAARNPFRALMQYDTEADVLALGAALASADVVHCHLDYGVLRGLVPGELGAASKLPPLVIHHHGSMLRKMAGFFAMRDRELGALRLISNLELTKYGQGLHWLPNPVPCAEYQALADRARDAREASERFRISHSPSKRHLKGTDEFLAACERLSLRGLPVEPVVIEGVGHREALEIKASCHAAFDSFWLGIQCSGLEAAAMGQPVIAGDAYVAAQYQALLGFVPYTYADTGAELEAAIQQLVESRDFRAEEAARVGAYCRRWHDEAAVALRYLNLLDEHMGWRTRLAIAPAPPVTVRLSVEPESAPATAG